MKSKKILILISCILIILISIHLINYFNSVNVFKRFANEITEDVIEKLEYKSIVGDMDFNLDVRANFERTNVIIDNAKYNGNYEIDFDDSYINVDMVGNYREGQLKNNIYIDNNKIYILLDNVFNKYITYDVNYLDVLNYNTEYRYIIEALNRELNEILSSKHFTRKNVKVGEEIFSKITLDLTKDYYNEFKKELIKNLSADEKFMESYANIIGNNLSKSILLLHLDNIDMSDYKIAIYLTRFDNEFVKLEIDSKDIDINLEYKNNKYSFEYYERDGLVYKGYIKYKNDNLNEVNVENNVDNYLINLKFNEFNIEYDQETRGDKKIDNKDSINHFDLNDNDKNIIKSNSTINKIYDNYLNRYYIYMEKPEFELDEGVI